ncbi:MAG: peptide-methionine (S)-S-oxide reductase MsrA [Planctomycetes bacterium]|nr:peptide-methionine (S)-S-oxide reductase MsrA [Planctomycetota bacterium]
MLNRLATVALSTLALCSLAAWLSAAQPPATEKPQPAESKAESKPQAGTESRPKLEVATLGSGCFWCGEAVFEEIRGVKLVVSGYSGGDVVNPTYEQVSTGMTGHAEVIQITFDPAVISFDEILEIFWKSHDPTKLNEQGPDHGTQYRSAIFYHSEEQREVAEKSKQKHTKTPKGTRKIVTEITKFSAFYPAEDYHQDFFKNNPRYRYCQAIVKPKVAKVRKEFKDQLKDAPEKDKPGKK